MTVRGRGRLSVRWTRADAAALTVMLAAGAAVLAVGFARSRSQQAPRDGASETVAERIDPNTAEAASLRRLPGVGPARADEIVAFRRAAAERGQVAFRFAEDLQQVKGVGPETIDQIAGWLSLPRRGEPGE